MRTTLAVLPDPRTSIISVLLGNGIRRPLGFDLFSIGIVDDNPKTIILASSVIVYLPVVKTQCSFVLLATSGCIYLLQGVVFDASKGSPEGLKLLFSSIFTEFDVQILPVSAIEKSDSVRKHINNTNPVANRTLILTIVI